MLSCEHNIVERGSPWENGYIESFNGKLRDELLNREIFTTLFEVSILIEEWRKKYSQASPHSGINYRSSTPEAIVPLTLTQQVILLMGQVKTRVYYGNQANI